MASEARRRTDYNQELVQVMKEHELIGSEEEEEEISAYLFITR